MNSRSKMADQAKWPLKDVEQERGTLLPDEGVDPSTAAGNSATAFALLRKMVASGKSVHSKANDQ